MRFACLLVLVASLAEAADQKERAPMGVVYAQDEAARTRFDCHYVDANGRAVYPQVTNAIECEFNAISLWAHADPEAAARKAAKDFDEGMAEEGPKKTQEVLASLRKECAKPENEAAWGKETARLKSHPRAAWFMPAYQASYDDWKKTCACTSLECMRSLAIEQAKRSAGLCTIASQSWKETFRRSGKAWVNVDEMAGCYSTITTTLMRAPDANSALLWNMRTTKVPRPDASKLLCGDGKIVDLTETWNSTGDFIQPDCTRFKFF